jgi:AcrR family transcriptional regulator
MSSTRERILDNALTLIDGRPDTVPSMSALARATGISRQALYLHFPDRAALLLAVVEHVDEREDLQGAVARVQAAPGGAAQVRSWAEMQASRNPRIAAVARALDQSRHGDEPAARAWRDRTANRMGAATAVVEGLRREGGVHRSWRTEEAAALLNEAGMPPERYVEMVTAAALAALAAPLPRGRRP